MTMHASDASQRATTPAPAPSPPGTGWEHQSPSGTVPERPAPSGTVRVRPSEVASPGRRAAIRQFRDNVLGW